MAIPTEGSWGDLAAGASLQSWAIAGADLALSGARAHQASQTRLALMAESQMAAWANVFLGNSAKQVAANRVTLTDSEAQNIAETAAVVQTLAKVFGGTS